MTSFQLLGWILDATLKGSVFIALVALLQILIGGRANARWRYALWLLVVLRLAIPAAPSSRWSVFNLLPSRGAAQTIAVPSPAVAVNGPSAPGRSETRLRVGPSPVPTVWRWIFGLWIAGIAALLVRSVVTAVRIRLAVTTALERGTPLTAGRLRIVESDAVDAPALHGIMQPVLLLPEGFSNSFSDDELRHVVLHELWHVRRLDVVVNWLLTAVSALHWFNPLVWFAVSRIREERELACDELALSCLEEEERSGYGMTIVKLLERFRAPVPVPALVGIVNHKHKMKRRLLMIANYSNRTRFPMLFAAAIAIVGLVGLTDARGGERKRIMKDTLDPVAAETMEKLETRVSFDVKDASFGDFLNAVSSKTGVVMTQSPGTATSPAQQAHFTIHAENVPAHAVLMATLRPFDLRPVPTEDGLTVFKVVDRLVLSEGSGPETHEEDVRIVKRSPEGASGENVKKQISITVQEGPDSKTTDGTLHRTLTFDIDENGVKSQGKLVIDIAGVK